jgi:hypothetical protein
MALAAVRMSACVCLQGVAVEYCLEIGLERIHARVCELAEAMRSGLRGRGVQVWDSTSLAQGGLCGIVSFSKVGLGGVVVCVVVVVGGGGGQGKTCTSGFAHG